MSDYKHGIGTDRQTAEPAMPKQNAESAVLVVGTAPINLASSPAVNVLVLAQKKSDAVAALGYCEEFDKYTLLHSVYSSFNKFGTGPVVFVNVLDPKKRDHLTALASSDIKVIGGKALLKETGVMLDKIVVSGSAGELKAGEDYVASFDEDGYVVLAATDTGAMKNLESISVAGSKLNPEGVTEADIIGGIDEDGNRSGLELVDEVFPRLGVVPTILIAPGFSKKPAVAAALEAKAQLIYSTTNAFALVDLSSASDGATKKEDVAKEKAKTTVADRWNVPLWPMALVDGYKIWMSAHAAALIQSNTTQHNGIPSDSPDNHDFMIDGLCLEDGTPVFMTQDDVNDYLNAQGICSALKLPTWKFWGNNTAAYPTSKAAMNRYIKSVLMLNWMENTFKLNYLSSIGRNASTKQINDIVDRFNQYLNGLTPDHLAGGSIVFDIDENPIEDRLAGRYKFRTRYADWIPTEYIENIFEYDVSILEAATEGGDE